MVEAERTKNGLAPTLQQQQQLDTEEQKKSRSEIYTRIGFDPTPKPS
jgi:hypothetical protein